MGEGSYTQLQLWDHGVASMVTPVGWYRDAPEGAVLYVRPDQEIEDIHKHLAALLDDPTRLIQVGDAGRRALQTLHGPELYVNELAELVDSYSALGLRRTSLLLGRKVGADAAGWLPASCIDLAFDRAAEKISDLCAVATPSTAAS